jgi:uncharacterized protein (DUF433 family)
LAVVTGDGSEVVHLIESNPGVMLGKPVIRGTRITVELILEKLSAGATVEELLQAHPRLTREAVHAVIELAKKKSSVTDGN